VTAFALDPAKSSHAAALELLAAREIGWLVSTGRDGFPHAVPVWFLWLDEVVVTFSQPRAAKVRNLEADPRAAFHLEAGDDGEEWLLLQGTAEFSPEPASAWFERIGDVYLEKYQAGLDALGWTPERMYLDFSLVILFRPHKLIS
jgi:PPOX class probable F420-dependent enzyme